MESVQVELPSDLLQQVRQEIPSEAALSQVVAEAIHMWLEKRLSERSRQEHVLQALRASGLVMTLEKQRALADAMMSPLDLDGMPGREDLEAVLARLKVPLSEEIIILIAISDQIIELAVDLTGRHPLRGYDAVHLATAVILNRALHEADAPPLTFVAADTRLCEAAGREGLLSVDPNQH